VLIAFRRCAARARFKETAREIGADESSEAFHRVLKQMTQPDKARRLPIDSPTAFQNAVDAIEPSERAYITFEDLHKLTGQTCEEFMADNTKLMGRGATYRRLALEPNEQEQRLYLVRKKSN
jgi:hypothetical protein